MHRSPDVETRTGPPQAPPAVQLCSVAKAYGILHPRPALRGVSLRIARGECYGLAGPNGAGKTTLLKILLGLIAPDSGEARLFGLRPDAPEVRRRVGFVPESAELPPSASPLQLVRRFARLRGLPARAALEEGEAHLRRLGMGDFLERPAHRFSKGEKQRTLLALALLGSPELLVLDEPTDGLDPLGRALMRRVIVEECAAGRTVFINSHLLSETERICSRVGILHQGRLVREEVLPGAAADVARQGRGTTALLLAAPLAAEVLVAAGLRPAGPSDSYLVDHEDLAALNRAVDAVRAAGGLLVEARRVRRDLEETLAEVAAAGDPLAEAPGLELPIEEAGLAPAAPARALRAALRVAREIASDLHARKLGYVALAGMALALGGTVLAVRNEIVQGLAAGARQLRAGGMLDQPQLAAMIGRGAAAGEFWVLLAGVLGLSALFAPPLLEPRRSALLFAQPVSRGDVASGIFLAVAALALLLFAFAGATLYLALRALGVVVPSSFLLVPLLTATAFAALYAGVLLVTWLWPSGLFAAVFALASLIALAIAGSSPAAEPASAHGITGFVFGLLPKIVGLSQQAMRLGGGGRASLFPIASTLAFAFALMLLVQLVSRRSER